MSVICALIPKATDGTFNAISVSRSSRTRRVGNKEMVLSLCFVHDEFKSSIRRNAALSVLVRLVW
jgi:hypothetical protein